MQVTTNNCVYHIRGCNVGLKVAIVKNCLYMMCEYNLFKWAESFQSKIKKNEGSVRVHILLPMVYRAQEKGLPFIRKYGAIMYHKHGTVCFQFCVVR